MSKRVEIKYGVIRGGSGVGFGMALRAANSFPLRQHKRYDVLGFRLTAREIEHGKARRD